MNPQKTQSQHPYQTKPDTQIDVFSRLHKVFCKMAAEQKRGINYESFG